MATGLALVAVVVGLMFVGAAVRLPCRDVCGSDVGRLYETRGIDRDHAPMFDRELEYPPLIGLTMYAAGYPFDGSIRPSFLLNAVLLISLAALTTWMLWRRYGGRVRRWVFSPPLIFEGLINWDLLSVAPATIGLLRWEAGAPFWAGVLIGVGAGAKLAPALYVPILAASCLPLRAGRRAFHVVAGAVVGVAVFALPVLVVAPEAIEHFLDFHGARSPTWGTIWFYVLRDPTMKLWVPYEHLAEIGTVITTVLVLAGLVVLVAYTLRGRLNPLVGCALATILFIVANKVYSPQYDLWLVPFFVMLPLRTKLVVRFYVASFVVFALSYGVSHVIDNPAFFYFMGAAVIYRLFLLAIIAREWIRAAHFDAADLEASDQEASEQEASDFDDHRNDGGAASGALADELAE